MNLRQRKKNLKKSGKWKHPVILFSEALNETISKIEGLWKK